MQKIVNFNDVHKVLAKFIPRNQKEGSYSLERIKEILQKLDNPQNSYRVIHIAGTSGKTSTCYYIGSLLIEAGQKVGMTVSPHVDEVNERVQINGVPLNENKFCKLLSEFIEIIDNQKTEPTYFELLIAFAFWVFAKEKVSYAVVEVGLGGLLDGTNVVSRPDKVSVITDIGLDHINVLGNTIKDIAMQKAGIIQSHNTVFCYLQDDDTIAAIRARSKEMHAQLHEINTVSLNDVPGYLPPFQQRNWFLAKNVYIHIALSDDLPKVTSKMLENSSHTLVPARMEIINYNKKTIVIDGSHNGPKMAALVEGFTKLFPNEKPAVLVSFVDSKYERASPALEQLLPITQELIVTSFTGEQDTPKHSVDPDKIAEQGKQVGFNRVEVVPDPKDAFVQLLTKPEQILLITGSFYLLNHIRPLILKK